MKFFAVFVLAGLGSAAIPFLTGTLSTSTNSLRTGLLAPTTAAACMIAAGWWTLRHERE